MRKLNLFMVLAVGFILVACTHQSVPKERQLAGIERSVFPVFVTGYNTSNHQQLTRAGFKTVNTADFRACSAVYVAPHLLATSVTVFPRERDGVTMYDPDSITILDGTTRLRASDVPFFDPETGLALIRTDYDGVPLTLWVGPLNQTDTLKRISHTFRLSQSGILAIPSWNIGPAVANYAVDSLFAATMFSVRTDLHPGSCGSPIIGRDGTLAGIISRRIGNNKASVIGPASIAQALRSLSDE